jgi:aminoglycoside phosphotransferase (APT) family kinase protein
VPDDARPVRAGEALNWVRVAAHLRNHLSASVIPGLDLSREPIVEQFHGGHSNLTYLLRYGDVELVLRRPPLGPLPPTAHDMAREHRWLDAIHPLFPLSPRPFLLCEDQDVAGAPFYVMERRHGLVVRGDEPPQLAGQPDARRRASQAMVEALAALHAVDVTSPVVANLGKPAGFVERQVRGWTERWHKSKTDEIPEMEALAAWLPSQLPPNADPPAIVHGDFKLDNVMLDPADAGRLVAIFDWEMTALGDPLIDVGIFLAYWMQGAKLEPNDALASVTNRPGWFSRDEVLECYAGKSGRDVSRIAFYETFALFKIAVVIQQIYFRFKCGQTTDERFARFDVRVRHLARQGVAAMG